MASKNIQKLVVLWLQKLYRVVCLNVLLVFKHFINCGGVEIKRKQEFQFENIQNNVIQSIPEAKGLPVVGTFFDLIAAGAAPKLHLYIDKRHQQYGNIFRERLGGTQDAVFVSSANLMRAVFFNEGSYPRHPLPEAWILYNKEHDCQRGLFFMDGEEWFHNRRILSRILLNGNLNWMDWHIRQCSNKLIQKWKYELRKTEEKTGIAELHIKNLEKHLYRWSIDVIISVMFGDSTDLDIKPIKKAVDDFSNIVHKIFETSSALMNFPPKLAKMLGLKMWSEFEESVQNVLSKGYDIIDLFLERTSAYPGGLYEKLNDADTPLDMIKRIFVDLVIAAGDTTSFSTTWAIYLLSQDDELQQKLYEEYNPNTHDTPLVRGLVKETLRLYPVAPFVGRYLPQTCMIGNYRIEKNSLVLLSLFTAGRNPIHFPEPLKVMPERWLRDTDTGEYRAVYEPHGTLPFAIGNRSCIGRKLAINQMQYFIAELAQHFHLKCTNSSPIESILRLVTVPNQPLDIAIRKRLE